MPLDDRLARYGGLCFGLGGSGLWYGVGGSGTARLRTVKRNERDVIQHDVSYGLQGDNVRVEWDGLTFSCCCCCCYFADGVSVAVVIGLFDYPVAVAVVATAVFVIVTLACCRRPNVVIFHVGVAVAVAAPVFVAPVACRDPNTDGHHRSAAQPARSAYTPSS